MFKFAAVSVVGVLVTSIARGQLGPPCFYIEGQTHCCTWIWCECDDGVCPAETRDCDFRPIWSDALPEWEITRALLECEHTADCAPTSGGNCSAFNPCLGGAITSHNIQINTYFLPCPWAH